MKAGRELDALIAEKVMGWTLQQLTTVTAWVDDNDGWTLKQMWNPSTDIRDAWIVVEKMNDRSREDKDFRFSPPHFKSKHYWTTGYGLGTECYYVTVSQNGQVFQSHAETAPLAICLAALRCKGIDV